MTQLVSALALLAVAALGPDLDVTVTPQQLTVGDRAELTLSLRLPEQLPTGAVSWPEWQSALGEVEILEIGPVESVTLSDGRRLLTQTLDVTFFEVGEAVIPPIGVELALAGGPTVISSDEVSLNVVSVLPADEAEPQAKPPAPPQPLTLGERFWWASGALLATCIVAMALLLQQSSRVDAASSTTPRLSPREELQRALMSLRAESDAESLHAGVSMTTRRYLGRVLQFAAPESTTSEIQRALRQRQIEADLVARTGRLLGACDMVKFARQDVSLESGRQHITEIESLADGVDVWLRPAEADDQETS